MIIKINKWKKIRRMTGSRQNILEMKTEKMCVMLEGNRIVSDK